MNGSEWCLKCKLLLKYTHGLILTAFVEDGVISANGEKSKIDWYGPLQDVWTKILSFKMLF